jgi:hypothetical protein
LTDRKDLFTGLKTNLLLRSTDLIALNFMTGCRKSKTQCLTFLQKTMMKLVITLFLLVFFGTIYCQKIEYTSDSVIVWTKEKGRLINPQKKIFAVPISTIWIDEKYKRIRIIHKGDDYFKIIKTLKRDKQNLIQTWLCIYVGMDGDQKCKITLTKRDKIIKQTEVSVDFRKLIYKYYCKLTI